MTVQLHVLLPADEKEELRAEADRHGVSMSALVRINNMQARAAREREELRRQAYPDKPSSM